MKRIIIIDDTDVGTKVTVFTQLTQDEMACGSTVSPATALGDFMVQSAEVYLETLGMPMDQARNFIKSITVKPTIN